MLSPRSALGLASVLTIACGPAIRDLDQAGTGTGTGGSGDTSAGSAEGPQMLPDLPPPERACEARGMRFGQRGGPWRVQEHLADYPPAYGLLPGDDDMLAIWKGPFYGQDPMPNFLGARVSYAGQRIGEVQPVFERPVTQEPAIHRAAEGYVLTYCGRHGANDYVTSQILDADAITLAPETIRSPQSSCGAARPEGVWTGERYLFAWTDNSSDQVLLDIGEADQTQSTSFIELAPDGNLSCPPRIAVGPTMVMMVAGIGNDSIHVFRFMHDGTQLGTVELVLPDALSIGQAAIGAASDGSFSLFVADRWDPGLYHTQLSDQGIGPALAPVEGATARYSDLQLLHRPGGFVLITDANDQDGHTRVDVIATDEQGRPTAIETLASDDDVQYEAMPAVAMHGEEAWVLYTAGYDDDTFDVRLAQLGCVG